ncbi:MAG TPA: prepilin-type N-terminal cleavage/methylation domain-containing protein, partial [Thermoanaerobaculia bacterium]|nr:prepilin-type N-terminal cleavage/methylation domain-containing protein [Thermoanaerobaculia bacterium]
MLNEAGTNIQHSTLNTPHSTFAFPHQDATLLPDHQVPFQPRRILPMRRSRGFSMVEVMVALA